MSFRMDWLKRFLPWWGRSQGDGNGVGVVTRFITSRTLRWNNADGFRLKPTAFLPKRSSAGRWELSVFWIDDLSEVDVWGLAWSHVVPPGAADPRPS